VQCAGRHRAVHVHRHGQHLRHGLHHPVSVAVAESVSLSPLSVCSVCKALKRPLPPLAVLALILLPPIIPVAAAAYNKHLGFARSLPVCSVLNRQSIPVVSGEN